MPGEPVHQSLDEALLAFQAEMPILTKDKKGQVGNQKTKYADLVQANAVVLTKLNSLGVIYTCAPHMLDDGKFVLKYALTHVPTGEHKGGQYPLKLSENPQQMGSAITYARRYVLLALTGVAADDEDDDGAAASGQRYAQRAAAPARRQAPREPEPEATHQPTAQRAQRPAGGPALPGEEDRMTLKQQGLMMALFKQIGMERPDRLQYVNEVLAEMVSPDRSVDSAGALTKKEAGFVIDKLQKFAAQLEPEGGDA